MYNNKVIELTQEALWLVLLMSGPAVVVAALVGIFIAFIQAATQLQEQTFQYAAKFFAIVLTLFITASFVGGSIYHYTDKLFTEFPSLVKQ